MDYFIELLLLILFYLIGVLVAIPCVRWLNKNLIYKILKYDGLTIFLSWAIVLVAVVNKCLFWFFGLILDYYSFFVKWYTLKDRVKISEFSKKLNKLVNYE